MQSKLEKWLKVKKDPIAAHEHKLGQADSPIVLSDSSEDVDPLSRRARFDARRESKTEVQIGIIIRASPTPSPPQHGITGAALTPTFTTTRAPAAPLPNIAVRCNYIIGCTIVHRFTQATHTDAAITPIFTTPMAPAAPLPDIVVRCNYIIGCTIVHRCTQAAINTGDSDGPISRVSRRLAPECAPKRRIIINDATPTPSPSRNDTEEAPQHLPTRGNSPVQDCTNKIEVCFTYIDRRCTCSNTAHMHQLFMSTVDPLTR
jgi:hypothetical protein